MYIYIGLSPVGKAAASSEDWRVTATYCPHLLLPSLLLVAR